MINLQWLQEITKQGDTFSKNQLQIIFLKRLLKPLTFASLFLTSKGSSFYIRGAATGVSITIYRRFIADYSLMFPWHAKISQRISGCKVQERRLKNKKGHFLVHSISFGRPGDLSCHSLAAKAMAIIIIDTSRASGQEKGVSQRQNITGYE